MNNLLETIVCSPQDGKESRFERILATRVEYRMRQDGCLKSWFAKSYEGDNLYIIQSIYQSKDYWIDISEKIKQHLDPKDGGVESCLIGPPLIGMFSIESDKILSS